MPIFDYFYSMDPYILSIILMIPAALFALWAQLSVKTTFSKFSKQTMASHMTGCDAARRILDQNGLRHVRIERVQGDLTDHFDPRTNVVRLSESVYDSPTVAAVGVAAHEAGHAVQYAEGYGPMKLRSAIIPVTNIGSNLSMPLILLGIILTFPPLAFIGVAAFSLSTVFQLVTLPVEFNASRRAVAALESGMGKEELKGAKKVLRAAAMTYVAALAVSLVNLLRVIAIASSSRRRR